MTSTSDPAPAASGPLTSPSAALAAWAEASEALADLVARVGAGTVSLRIGRGHRGTVACSGAVWRDGVVVTTAHALRRPPREAVVVGEGGAERHARLAGLDARTDLAVFKLDDADASWPPVERGDAAAVRAGHLVVAIGRSSRGDLGASWGMVHRASGPWQTWLGGAMDERLELDGGLHEGQSGAPVADLHGRVIGIASPALSRRRAVVVPAGTVDGVVDALLAGGRVERPYLGLGAQPVVTGGRSGLLVTALVDEGPAAAGGLLVGDIVVAAAGQPVSSLPQLRAAVGGRIGDDVTLDLVRGGTPQPVTLTVGRWPAGPCAT